MVSCTWSIAHTYWPYNIMVVEVGQAASSAKIKPNPGRVSAVFQISGLEIELLRT